VVFEHISSLFIKFRLAYVYAQTTIKVLWSTDPKADCCKQ